VRVGVFVYGVSNSEDFDEPTGESTAYSPKLVEGVFSEVRRSQKVKGLFTFCSSAVYTLRV
jgi:hypothetical protein